MSGRWRGWRPSGAFLGVLLGVVAWLLLPVYNPQDATLPVATLLALSALGCLIGAFADLWERPRRPHR